jgi:CO/xanthine dehydrogenase Mo-binding subunit
MENLVYDDDGNPLSSTFVDYLLPTATEVPPIEFGHIDIPGPVSAVTKASAKAAPSDRRPR